MNELSLRQQLQAVSDCWINIECDENDSDLLRRAVMQLPMNIGVLQRREYFYESMRVKEYLNFFAAIHNHRGKVGEAMEWMELTELARVRIDKLTSSEARRLAIAREIVHDPELYFLEEPLLSLDETSRGIVLRWLEQLKPQKLISTTVSLKMLYLLPGSGYVLENGQLTQLDQDTPELESSQKLEKIAVRLDEKIILLDPDEIDYAESVQGKCRIVVRDSEFVCSQTMEELQERLESHNFFRCHRSYLINMNKVSELVRWTRNSYGLKLKNRTELSIPLSKGRLEELKKTWNL